MNTGSKRAPLLLDKGTPSFTFLTNYDFKSSILLLHVQVMFFMVTMPFQCLVLDDPVNQAWHKMLDDSHNKKICNSIRLAQYNLLFMSILPRLIVLSVQRPYVHV